MAANEFIITNKTTSESLTTEIANRGLEANPQNSRFVLKGAASAEAIKAIPDGFKEVYIHGFSLTEKACRSLADKKITTLCFMTKLNDTMRDNLRKRLALIHELGTITTFKVVAGEKHTKDAIYEQLVVWLRRYYETHNIEHSISDETSDFQITLYRIPQLATNYDTVELSDDETEELSDGDDSDKDDSDKDQPMKLSDGEKFDCEKYFLEVENQLLRERNELLHRMLVVQAQPQEPMQHILSVQLSALQHKYEELSAQLRIEQARFSEMYLKRVLTQGDNIQLNEKLQEQSQNIDQLYRQLEAQNQTIAELSQESLLYREMMEDKNKALAEYFSHNEQLNTQVEELTAAVEAFRSRNQRLKAEVSALRQQLNERSQSVSVHVDFDVTTAGQRSRSGLPGSRKVRILPKLSQEETNGSTPFWKKSSSHAGDATGSARRVYTPEFN